MKKKQNKKVNRVLLTGGHAATTAIATVEELIKRGQTHIYWVGSRKAIEGASVPTLESEALPKLGVSVYPIIAGRLQRRFTIWTIPSLFKIPLGFLHAFLILRRIRPDVILSFGGYAAFPVVVVGHFMRTPILLHEQTAAIGRANKFSAPFADKIAIARLPSAVFFPKGKISLVGNPVMSQTAKVRPKEKLGDPPVIFVTAGSRGSESINNLIKEILTKLLQDFRILHQTGSLDFERFNKLKRNLPSNLRQKYVPFATIDPNKISTFYERADIIISRAGANTVAEIMVVKRPSILIPLPFAYYDEQKKNALFAQKFGVAKVLDQKGLTPEKLLGEIYRTKKDWYKTVAKVKSKTSDDIDAAGKLVDVVEKLV